MNIARGSRSGRSKTAVVEMSKQALPTYSYEAGASALIMG
jgi:hypothetical protein